MQENNRHLVDEALTYEPIRNTFLLGWEWISINKEFTAMALGIYILFNILGVSFLGTVFAIIIQIYIGRIFYTSNDITSYVDTIKQSTREKLLKDTLAPSFGAYLGWTFLTFIIGLLVLLFILNIHDLSSLNVEALQTSEAIEANMELLKPLLMAFSMPLSFLILLVLYIKPLVDANITLSRTFKEGFSSVFTTFSLELWRKAMRSDYLFYVLKLYMLLIGMMLPIGFLLSLIGLNLLTYILIFILLYIINIIMAIASMLLRRMVE